MQLKLYLVLLVIAAMIIESQCGLDDVLCVKKPRERCTKCCERIKREYKEETDYCWCKRIADEINDPDFKVIYRKYPY